MSQARWSTFGFSIRGKYVKYMVSQRKCRCRIVKPTMYLGSHGLLYYIKLYYSFKHTDIGKISPREWRVAVFIDQVLRSTLYVAKKWKNHYNSWKRFISTFLCSSILKIELTWHGAVFVLLVYVSYCLCVPSCHLVFLYLVALGGCNLWFCLFFWVTFLTI